MDCPFCHIPQQEKHRMLYEGDKVVAILSNPRLMPGHTLVIPKRHVEKLSELTSKELPELMNTVIKFEEQVLDNIAPGCDISQHYRPFIAQNANKVDHLHVHLHPRWNEDELYEKAQINHNEIFTELKDKERKEMKEKLKITDN